MGKSVFHHISLSKPLSLYGLNPHLMSDSPVPEADGPFEEQRQIYELLSQETRHLILQFILGHPKHLPSLGELAFMVPKNKAAIREQIDVLVDADVVERYEHPPNQSARDLPSLFYGLTEYGVDTLSEYNYLRGLPIARAVYDNTRLSEKVQRHRDAPRPELPHTVASTLSINESDGNVDVEELDRVIREYQPQSTTIDDQIAVTKAFYEADIGPDHDGIKRTELNDVLSIELEHSTNTVLSNLVEGEFLEKFSPLGPTVLAISERNDEFVMGQVTEEAESNIEAIVSHIDDELQPVTLTSGSAELAGDNEEGSTPSVAMADGAGRTIRRVLAEAFDVRPEAVVDHLRSGDPVDRLNTAMDAIESAEEVRQSEEYGRIVFVNQAQRYRLTERAVKLLS